MNKFGLSGRFKTSLHYNMPTVLGPLILYAVPITTVDFLKIRTSSFLHKWLDLPCSINSTTKNGTSSSLWLTEDLNVARARDALQNRNSSECKASSAWTGGQRTGREWTAENGVEVSESPGPGQGKTKFAPEDEDRAGAEKVQRMSKWALK